MQNLQRAVHVHRPFCLPSRLRAPCCDALRSALISGKRQRGLNRMNIDLSGKTALVSGSTSGIGFAIAKGLARVGRRGCRQRPHAGERRQGGYCDREGAAKGESCAASPPMCRRQGLRAACRGGAGDRHPRQQRRDLRAEGFLRDHGRGVEDVLRGERPVRRAAVARLHEGHAAAELGAHRLHLLGVGAADSAGDDPLRRHQDRPARPSRAGWRS